MTSQFKNFIKGLNVSAEAKAFMVTNRLTISLANITKTRSCISFEQYSEYYIHESIKLNKAEVKVWDLFYFLDKPKNAIATILYLIEKKHGVVTNQILNDQTRLTPKRDLPRVETFTQFWATLNKEDKLRAQEIAAKWLDDYCAGVDSFSFFQINDGAFKADDFVKLIDANTGESMYTQVVQAEIGGFITCVAARGTFSLSKHSKPRVVKKSEIPTELLSKIELAHIKEVEGIDEHKQALLEKAIKVSDKRAEEARRAARREAKVVQDNEDFAQLQTLALKTAVQIKKAKPSLTEVRKALAKK